MNIIKDVIIALIFGSICIAAYIMIMYFAYQGGKKDRKANMDKIVILTSIAIALTLGMGIFVAAFFFN